MHHARELEQSSALDAVALDAIAAALDSAAADEEAGLRDISGSIDQLRRAGWLTDDGASAPTLTATRLRRIGAANLPVGRLWEGHMNALYLARVHGDPKIAGQVGSLVSDGAFLGVWGADGVSPLRISDDGKTLTGAKIYASGLGTVTHAVVTVNSGPDVCLALCDVQDEARADASIWQMQGMRATASGGYDFARIALGDLVWLGNPGDYVKEPHFVGGVWRIAALQIGAALGLLEATANSLRARGRLDAPAQMARLSATAIRALGASALTTRAACAAGLGGDGSAETIASISAAARLLTEEVALEAIQTTEQCLGLAHFEVGSATNRKTRDLAVYLRQAARDAFQTRVGRACFSEAGELWNLF